MGSDQLFQERDDGLTEPYRGRLGQTSFEPVLWTDPAGRIVSVRVYTVVNATTDPVLADRLCAGTLNWVRWAEDEELFPVKVPVVYHDETKRLFVLVLPEDYRCRELEERAALLQRLAQDKAHDVPDYVLNFKVVFGTEELSNLVAPGTRQEVETTPVRKLPPEFFERAKMESLEETEPTRPTGQQLEARAVLQAEADAVLREMEGEVMGWPPDEESEEDLATQQEPTVVKAVAPTVGRDLLDEEAEVAHEEPPAPQPKPERDTIEGDTDRPARPAVGDEHPALPEELADLAVRDRLLLRGEDAIVAAARLPAEEILPFLGKDAKVILQLRKMERYPLVVLSALSDEEGTGQVHWILDVLSDEDPAILDALAKDFRVRVMLYDDDLRERYVHEAHYPLEENAKAISQRAMEYLTDLGDVEPDLEGAIAAWQDPTFERIGRKEHGFAARSFEKIESPQQAATAIGILDWWLEPEHEEYLLFVKSFPIVWWRRIKQRVMKAALDYGLWPSERLVSLLLAEGYATSRKDLIRQMLDHFTVTVQSGMNDLDLPQEHDNWTLLLKEAEAAGVVVSEEAEALARQAAERMETAKMAKAIQAESTEEAAGSIPLDESDIEEIGPSGSTAEDSQSLRDLPTEELLALLDSKETRVKASLILCERRDPDTVAPLFEAAKKMTRSEVLQVLPLLVSFGAAAEPHFVSFLKSNKSFLRQGAALALGILRSSTALDALVDCLLDEPTGIWKEVARVIGEIGPGVVVTLASRATEANAEGRERIAYALAHLLVASGDHGLLRDYLDTEGPMAAIARRAYELEEDARQAAAVYEREGDEDESVVTSFTRQFLRALHEGEELTDADILEEEPES